MVENKILSSIRNSPRLSIGLPINKNKPYWKETAKDFIGKSSPRVTSYDPDLKLTKGCEPKFSQPKFMRFYKPSSVANLQKQLPIQYISDKPQQPSTNHDLMGRGTRFTYKLEKKDEINPGPGKYNDEASTIKSYVQKSHNGSKFNSRLAFGTGKDERDKLQGFGQERHFLGRAPAFGEYEIPERLGANSSFNRSNQLICKTDRELLPLSKERELQKSRVYNNSHAHLSPCHYQNDASVLQSNLSTFRKSDKLAK